MTVQSTTKAENKNEIFECTSTFLPFFREIGYGTNKWFFSEIGTIGKLQRPLFV